MDAANDVRRPPALGRAGGSAQVDIIESRVSAVERVESLYAVLQAVSPSSSRSSVVSYPLNRETAHPPRERSAEAALSM